MLWAWEDFHWIPLDRFELLGCRMGQQFGFLESHIDSCCNWNHRIHENTRRLHCRNCNCLFQSNKDNLHIHSSKIMVVNCLSKTHTTYQESPWELEPRLRLCMLLQRRQIQHPYHKQMISHLESLRGKKCCFGREYWETSKTRWHNSSTLDPRYIPECRSPDQCWAVLPAPLCILQKRKNFRQQGMQSFVLGNTMPGSRT